MSRPCCAPCRPGQEVASWLICTRAFQRRYGLGITRPAPLPVRPFIRSGYHQDRPDHRRARAQTAGSTLTGWSGRWPTTIEHARKGEDPAFGRGSTLYNRYQGDARNQPEPLRRADRARAVLRGQGGPRQLRHLCRTAHRWLRPRAGRGRRAIPGLYAAGTDMASVMGGHYPAGGINLGPAMTFGYIAGRHAAGRRRGRAGRS